MKTERCEEHEAEVERLARENFPLVLWAARRMKNRNSLTGNGQHDDLVGAGAVGLMLAARRFDKRRGVKFGTYAIHWIRRQMLNEMFSGRSIVTYVESACRRKGITPRAAESLDGGVDRRTGESFPLTAILPALDAPDGPIRSMIREEVRRAVAQLDQNEQFVIRHRFGLGGGEEETLEQVGYRMRRSRERVRQIEMQSLRRLRKLIGAAA